MAGMAGMSESEFWGCSLRYLYNRLEGHRKGFEMQMQVQYEVARYGAMLALLPNVKKGKEMKPTDLGKFRWELSEKELAELEKEQAPTDPAALAAMQEKVFKAIEEGKIKWEPVGLNEIK
jgi:hypothetical protein